MAAGDSDGRVGSKQEKASDADPKNKDAPKTANFKKAPESMKPKMSMSKKPAKQPKATAKAKSKTAGPKLKKRLSNSIDVTPLKFQRVVATGNDEEDAREGKGDKAKSP